jgi:hypothetical protein
MQSPKNSYLAYSNAGKILIKLEWLQKPLIFVGVYALWTATFRLLTLSILTYFSSTPTTRLQEISDIFSSNEITLIGISVFIFTVIFHQLNPLHTASLRELFSKDLIEKNFLPGFMQGTVLALLWIVPFLLTDVYRYFGYVIQMSESPFEAAHIAVRATAIASLVYFEEYLFRSKLSGYLKAHLSPWITVQAVAIFYAGTKFLQFDLSLTQMATLYLLSITLSIRAQKGDAFSKGAGFWTAMLIVFHTLLSIPIFGNDFTGVLLLKFQTSSLDEKNLGSLLPLKRIFTGGVSGPISSLALQLLLILDIGRSMLKRKKDF